MSSSDTHRNLTRDEVVVAIRPLLPVLERLTKKVRIVGTASSILRGIDLPVGDVDILAKERPIVDELAAAAVEAGGIRLSAPTWMENPGFGQYFAEYDLLGIRFSFSTAELLSEESAEVEECTGDSPWNHFDLIELEGHKIPVVASELRLLTEIARSRPERWRPIGARLQRDGYNEALFAAALERLPFDYQKVMKSAVAKDMADE